MIGSDMLLRQLVPFDKFGFWFFYAYQDIKNKYSRSVLGPLWVSLSIAVTIFSMGPLYGALFGYSDIRYYLYLATGIVAWYYFSGTLGESTTAFTAHEVFIKQSNIPLPAYVLRICVRNFIILLHNLVVLFIVYLWVEGFSIQIFLILPTLAIIFLVLYLLSIALAFFCARFRDLIPLVSNLLQLAMFLTPVFWVLTESSARTIYTKFNPFYYLLSAFRAPFGVGEFSLLVFSPVLIGAGLLFFVDLYLLKKYSRRVVYWV